MARGLTVVCMGTMLLLGFAHELAQEPTKQAVSEPAKAASFQLSPEAHATTQKGLTILHAIVEEVKKELSSTELSQQIFNAAIAFVIGLIMCFNGEFVFKQIIVLCVFLFVSILAIADLKLRSPEYHHGWRLGVLYFIAVECGLLAGTAAHMGFQGVKFMLGAGLGLAGARMFEDFITPFVEGSGLTKVVESLAAKTGVGTIAVIVGVWLLNGGKTKKFQAFIGAVVGGGLVTSVVCFAVQTTTIVEKKALEASMSGFKIPAQPFAWIEYAKLVFHPNLKSADVGLFKGSVYEERAKGYNLDLIGAYVLWLILAILGFRYQVKASKEGRKIFLQEAERKLARTISDTVDNWRGEGKKDPKAAPLLLSSGRAV